MLLECFELESEKPISVIIIAADISIIWSPVWIIFTLFKSLIATSSGELLNWTGWIVSANFQWKLSYWNGRNSETGRFWSCQESEKWRLIKNFLWLIWLRSTRIIPTGDAQQIDQSSMTYLYSLYESYLVLFEICPRTNEYTCRAFKEGIRSLSSWYLVMWNCIIRYVIGRGWFPDCQSPAIRPVISLALSNHLKLPFDNNSQRQMIRSRSVDGKCSQIVLRSR